MASKFRQDMPPQGGYGPIQWTRVIKKQRIGGYAVWGGFFVLTFGGLAINHYIKLGHRLENLEMKDACVAMQPLVLAERHRMYLRHLRKNRDEENELMKNVPGWETGTLYGEPVYHNQAGRFHIVNSLEYFMHNKWGDCYDRMFDHISH